MKTPPPAAVIRLPPGYRFQPSVEELINVFLRKKLNGETLPHDTVFEVDLYGDKEPWMIFNKDLQQTFYVFTHLKNISGSRIKRTAGCGTWEGQKTDGVRDSMGQLIGFQKLLSFEVAEAHSSIARGNGRWIMHEFSIRRDDKYVLCRVRNKELDKAKPMASLEVDESQEVHARKCGQGDDDENHSRKRLREGEFGGSNLCFPVVVCQGTAYQGFDCRPLSLQRGNNPQQSQTNTENVYYDDDVSCRGADEGTVKQEFDRQTIEGGNNDLHTNTNNVHGSNNLQHSNTNTSNVHEESATLETWLKELDTVLDSSETLKTIE
ncbi:NAC domain-containing protein 41 [Ricinus communis]|uniref:NAC domain-containing protein 41 n=1 Tax=Ricinus communis TaxID=3988 RepID=UPI00201ACD4D|nr:NAC domain-containing protein 41 [Ricinus communis]